MCLIANEFAAFKGGYAGTKGVKSPYVRAMIERTKPKVKNTAKRGGVANSPGAGRGARGY